MWKPIAYAIRAIWKTMSYPKWFANIVSWGSLALVGNEILPDSDEKTKSYIGLSWVTGIITGIILYLALTKLITWSRK